MAYQHKFDWKHIVLTICGVGSAVCSALTFAGEHGQAIPIAAGTLAAIGMVFGYISHSLTSPSPPPVVVAVTPLGSGPATVVSSSVVPPPVQT